MNIGRYRFSLPLDWQEADAGLKRRHAIGNVQVSDSAVDTLNRTIEKVDASVKPLSADQIVSCGRQVLGDSPSDLKLPLCIFERFKTLALMDAMVKDFDWTIEDVSAYRVEVVLDYVKWHEELIPHDAPHIGHLDDAILVEASTGPLLPELENYTDYRRLRKIEAELQGKPLHEFRYRRDDWLESREAERALIAYQREQGLSSFLSGFEVRLFKVH